MHTGGKYIPVLLSLVVWTAVLRVPLTYAYYILDTEGFIERLCENKDKPSMNCDGKCYLSKMWQADSEPEDKPMPVIPWSRFEFFPTPVFEGAFTMVEWSKHDIPPYRNNYLFLTTGDCFHPPPVTA